MLKRIAIICAALLLFPVFGWATDYYVAPSVVGSGNCTSGNECALATANAAVDGTGEDVVIMTAGTYTTGIVPAASGASDSIITYTVDTDATVTITAARGIDWRNGQDYITVQRGNGAALRFSENSYRVVDATGADHNVIDGIETVNVVLPSDTGRGIYFYDCDYLTIKNNTITNDNTTQDRYCDYVYIKDCDYLDIGPNNSFGDATHSLLYIVGDSQYFRVHNNIFTNQWRRGLEIRESGGDPQDGIVENNYFDNCGWNTNNNPYSSTDTRGRSSSSIQVGGYRVIVRNNIFYKGDIPILFHTASTIVLTDCNTYHNTIYNPQDYGYQTLAEAGSGVYLYNTTSILRNNFKNNIVYDPVDGYVLAWFGTGTFNNDAIANNIFYDSDNFRIRYRTSTYTTVTAAESAHGSVFTSNIQSAPTFVDVGANNFSLDSGSQGEAAASFLATIQTDGINTETDIITLDSYEGYAFASADFWIPNFNGDIVYAQDGANARVVSRTADTITVDDASVFSVGDTLTVIEFSGVAPDIGVGASNSTTPGTSPIYTGWYSNSGTPTTTPSSVSLASSDRTYLRKFTATSNGTAYSVRLYIGNQFAVNYAWAVAYKMVGTTLTLIGYAPITSPTLNAWTDEIILLEPASEDMDFLSGADVYWGIQFDPSGNVEVGRESTGGPGLYYSTKTISGTPITELLNTDMETPYAVYNPAYVFGYTITDDTDDPTVTITSPTSDATYNSPAGANTINLSGTCSDASSHVVSITWADNHGNSGSGSIADPWTSWTINNLVLAAGSTEITVTATDSYDNTNTDTITVTFVGPIGTLIGWDNSDNPPNDAISSSDTVTSDRIYLNDWTADAAGQIKGVYWYVGDTWVPTNAWVVAYKVDGTDYVLLSRTAISSVAQSSYNYIQFQDPISGQTLNFSSSDQILYGIAFDAGSGIKYGRETSGGSGMFAIESMDLSTGPDDIDTLTETVVDYTTRAGGFTLVYASQPADTTSPSIEITTPSAGTLSLLSNHYTIAGTASDETELSSVSWYCEETDEGDGLEISVGAWSTTLWLTNGNNTVTIRAVDATGNIATDTVVITYTHEVFGGSVSGGFQ